MLKRCQGGRNMYQIGKFAKMNNVSLHTLRWYDNIGILKAHKKDKFSKFRFIPTKTLEFLTTFAFYKALILQLKKFLN